jgi:hypothetical protein
MPEMTATVFLETILRGDEKVREEIRGIAKDVVKVDKETAKVGKSQKSWLSQIKAGWIAIAAAIGGTVRALVRFGKDTIAAASSLEEANSKFNVVFAGVRAEAAATRKDLVNAYAMSTLEATNFMSRMQDMLVPMGFARKEAVGMSGDIVKLAADLGSFNEMPTEEVMMGIQSALAGQIEPMRRYGVFLTQARIQQEALNAGLWDGTGAISQQAKAQATLIIIQKDSKDAIGDMSRTYDNWANVMKRIKAVMDDLMAVVGKELIAAFRPALAKIVGMAGNMDEVRDRVYRVVAAFKFLINVVTLTVRTMGALMRLLAQPIIALIKTVGDLGDAWQALMERRFKDASKKAGEAIGKNWDGMIDRMGETITDYGNQFENAWNNLVIIAKGRNEELVQNAKDTAEEIAKAQKRAGEEREKAHKETADEIAAREQRLKDELNQALWEHDVEWKAVYSARSDFLAAQSELAKTLASKEWAFVIDAAREAMSAIANYQKARSDANIANIKAESNAQIKTLDDYLAAGIITEEEYQTQKKALERGAEREIATIRRKAFLQEKKMKIGQAIMSAALAILKAWELGPIKGAIAAGIIGKLTQIQIKAIRAEPPPEVPAYAHGGLAGQNGPELIMVGEKGPELIVPARETALLQAPMSPVLKSLIISKLIMNVNGGTPGAVEREIYAGINKVARRLGVTNRFRERGT